MKNIGLLVTLAILSVGAVAATDTAVYTVHECGLNAVMGNTLRASESIAAPKRAWKS